MGRLNGTTTNDEPWLSVEIIAGSVTIVLEVFQQLAFAGLVQVGQGLNGSFYGQLSSSKQAVLLLLKPVLPTSDSLSGQRQSLLSVIVVQNMSSLWILLREPLADPLRPITDKHLPAGRVRGIQLLELLAKRLMVPAQSHVLGGAHLPVWLPLPIKPFY
jgi:hypothetical protein